MVRKILLLISLFYVLNGTSQEDTVRIDLKTANRVINDLEELDSLRVESNLNNLLIARYKMLTKSMETSLHRKDLQGELLQRNYNLVTEKTFWQKTVSVLKYIGVGVLAFASGYVVAAF